MWTEYIIDIRYDIIQSSRWKYVKKNIGPSGMYEIFYCIESL